MRVCLGLFGWKVIKGMRLLVGCGGGVWGYTIKGGLFVLFVTICYIALQFGTMEDKFKKNTNCEYCEKEMEAKYRNKRFCSDKCRTYWNREQKVSNPTKDAKKPPVSRNEPQERPKTKKEVDTTKKENTVGLSSFERFRQKKLGL